MHSERQHPHTSRTDHSRIWPNVSTSPWANLRLSVPNDRTSESIVAFVECVLVELTHEDVGAEYVSSNIRGTKRTQFIAVDDVGETFQRRHYDERLGYHKTTVSRKAVRRELINRLTRSSSTAVDRTNESVTVKLDTFCVKPIRQL